VEHLTVPHNVQASDRQVSKTILTFASKEGRLSGDPELAKLKTGSFTLSLVIFIGLV
jgi:hypothetical protein